MSGAPQRVGILGVGHLAACIVPRLARARGLRVLLSPRNAERSAQLAADHAGVEVARDNAALVTRAEVVVLCTRPAQAAAAVAGLPWRPGQTLISLCAGLPLQALLLAVGPAQLVRAMPVSAALIGESPTCLHPESAAARSLLERLGPVHAVDDEARFEVASVNAAMYGWVHALIAESARWSAEAGLAPGLARALAAQTVRAAAGMVMARPGASLDELVAELCTPGGITELGLHTLADAGALEQWRRACAAVLERLRHDAQR